MRASTPNPPTRARRRGAVTVEIAIALPVLLSVIIGIVESCNIIYLKHSLTVAAYEGARAAIGPAANSTDINLRAGQVLTDRNVNGGVITISPSPLSSATYGTYVTVEAAAPYAGNSILPGFLFAGTTIRAPVRMMKEY